SRNIANINSSTTTHASVDSPSARREYFLRKQREYRNRVKSERENLFEELALLQGKLANLPRAKLITDYGMLSWQVVASVFQEASRDSEDTLRKLQSRVDAKRSLIYEMMRFL
ncbi:hypothetical protein AC1031_011972, partial [Aphanomyces cochlioides]